jgi:hypothetical protein
MSRPKNIIAATALFNELSDSPQPSQWEALHPIISASNEVLGDAVASWRPAIAAEIASPQQPLPSAWCAAAAAGLRLVASKMSQPEAAAVPVLAVQSIGMVVSGFSDLLYQFHGHVVTKEPQGRQAADRVVQLMAETGAAMQRPHRQ